VPFRNLLAKAVNSIGAANVSLRNFFIFNLFGSQGNPIPKSFGMGDCDHSMWTRTIASELILFLILPFLVFSCAAGPAAVHKERAEPPEEAYYLYILGYSAEREGRWEDALKYYNQALDLDPSSPYLKTQISGVLVRTGKMTDAISLLENIITTEPDYVPALMLLGELYNSQKKFEESIRLYTRVLEIQPDNQEAALFLATLYANRKEYDRALEALEKLVNLHPDNVMAIYYSGLIYLEKKDLEKAAEYFQSVIDQRPNFDAAYLNLGLISEMKENP
jgi:tetratricopeptide (TPR) repeat protein